MRRYVWFLSDTSFINCQSKLWVESKTESSMAQSCEQTTIS